jgi:hypothetical protein
MSSNADQLEAQSDLERITMSGERVMEIPTNSVHADDKFATDVNMESKDKILEKINIEIDLFQRTTVYSNDPSMWI